jgi:hypothetical protein
MKPTIVIAFLAAALALSACEKYDKTVDSGIDTKHLSQMRAGIWIDPHGCDHWIIDDGAEGYLSQRLDRYGKPVCSGVGAPGTTVGKFKNRVPDPI